MPDLELEDSFKGPIAGIDEAGRGPWAGPVVASAVILNRENIPAGLNDSKKLSAQKRETLRDKLWQSGAIIGIGLANVEEIDRLGILKSTFLAMQRAIDELKERPEQILVDGNLKPYFGGIPTLPVIKGDGKSLSIAAASIIAKTYRDDLMGKLAAQFPGYGWEKNMGYGTKLHQDGLKLLGVTSQHRLSFAPIKKILSESN